MNHEEYAEASSKAQRSITPCPKCKVWPVIQYEPGVTFAECKCRKYAVPDEDRERLVEVINKAFGG